MSCSAELNQNLVSQRVLLLIAHSICALRYHPEPLVRSIYDYEPTLGVRPA